MRPHLLIPVSIVLAALLYVPASFAGTLLVGTARTSITPSEPVAICGQFALRIARDVETPVTANVIALESRVGDQLQDLAIMVSCDVVYIPSDLLEMVRRQVHGQLPDLDTKKIFLNGTHTHTAPVLVPGKYKIPKEGVMQVDAYRKFFAQRVGDAIVKAWKGRVPGSVTWGLSDAVVAYNRRSVYADGTARMYGPTNVAEFRNLEGYEDHDINTLFFWNEAGTLIGAAVNVSCPTQEVEARSTINADFLHPVRQSLYKKYGDQLCVLGWVGAAGDQSPHLMYRKAADERMRNLRKLDRLYEIARRIVRAVDEAYEVVQNDRHADVPLVHHTQVIKLPMRLVKESEYEEAKRACEEAEAAMKKDPAAAAKVYRRLKWYEVTVQRYEAQQANPKPTLDTELHVVRIGDAVLCTNAFEFFTDYGIRIKARSKAVQTFVIQLVGPGTYLPTEKAVRGGHYSAVVHSSLVGPEGGQMIVDRTVEEIDALFE
ncbi:MAG: hypothetical protein ACC628_12085 [Pirellulaceae bacterium]